MRNLLIVLFVVCSIPGFSQCGVYQRNRTTGVENNGGQFDSTLSIPKGIQIRCTPIQTDTANIRYNQTDSSIYIWTGMQYIKQLNTYNGTTGPIILPGGTTQYTVPAGSLVEKVEIIEPTSITIDMGTTSGAHNIAQAIPVSTGYGNFSIDFYTNSGTTLYFTGATINTIFKIYLR